MMPCFFVFGAYENQRLKIISKASENHPVTGLSLAFSVLAFLWCNWFESVKIRW